MCSSEYCRPYFGRECAELPSFSIRGLQGRAGLAASRPVAPRTQQTRDRGGPGPGAEGQAPPAAHIFLFSPRTRLDRTSEMRNWMSCGVERHGQPGPEESHRGPRRPAAHLVDDLLLLGVLLSQAGHLSPQGLVLAATQWVWSGQRAGFQQLRGLRGSAHSPTPPGKAKACGWPHIAGLSPPQQGLAMS